MMKASLVDFHCHLDLFPDPIAAIREADDSGIRTLTVTTTPKAWPRNQEMTQSSRFVRAALGLHPELVAERAGEISLFDEYLPQARYVGEVGIDGGPRFYRSVELQKQIFAHILKSCALAGGRVLSVHSLRAVKIVLDLIEHALPEKPGQFVLHWFTGSKSEARRAADLGCFFSINLGMLANEKGRELVASLPLERVLTETDGPFTQISGRPARPADVAGTVAGIADLRRLSSQEICDVMRSNLKMLLSGLAEDE
jgi:TatD DNase family protein